MDQTGDLDMAPLRRDGQAFQKWPRPRFGPGTHDMIARRLRLHYEELQQRPLPCPLVELLRKLDELPGERMTPKRN